MTKGDQVEAMIQVGDHLEKIVVEATRAGRNVDVNRTTKSIDIIEQTRSGSAIRTVTLRPDAVVAIIERPVDREKS